MVKAEKIRGFDAYREKKMPANGISLLCLTSLLEALLDPLPRVVTLSLRWQPPLASIFPSAYRSYSAVHKTSLPLLQYARPGERLAGRKRNT